jgi:ribosomal subunit interface protein
VCEVTVEGHGHHVRVKAAGADPFAAVDAAVDKLEQRLHRLKTKLVGRSQPRRRAMT